MTTTATTLIEPAPRVGDRAADAAPPELAADAPPPHIVIQPTRGWAALQLRELWNYRELLFFLGLRDVKVRYKQTVLGVAWAVLVPLLTMVVFNVLFGLLMGKGNKPTAAGVPYAVSTFCALVPWQMFLSAINASSNSIVQNRNLITKVYFPRLIAPLAPIISALVDFAIAFAVLVAMIAFYHVFTDYAFTLSWRLLALPFFLLLAVLTAVSLSLWLSALNAIYRDVKYALPFLTQLLMFASPVVYTTGSIMSGDVPEWVRVAYGLNPLVGVLEGFRWALLGQPDGPGLLLIPSTAVVLLMLVGGMYYFRRMERTFADLA